MSCSSPNLAFIKRYALILFVSLHLSACGLLNTLEKPDAQPNPVPEPIVVAPSPMAIILPARRQIRFAQIALKSLGYKLGAIDSIWGPRSVRAMQKFERDNSLNSANGHLSDLNLSQLEALSGISQNKIRPAPPKKKKVTSIASKIDSSIPLANAPQLVFVDRAYSLLSKPNPFSEPINIIRAGTGIYIIDIQDGWYQVQAADQQRGFIKEK